MVALRKLAFATTAALVVSAPGSASAATYLFTFEFDATTYTRVTEAGSTTYSLAPATIAASADSVDPMTLTYVSGNVNGATSPTLAQFFTITGPAGQRAYQFGAPIFGLPDGGVGNIFFSLFAPLAAGQTYETTQALRGVSFGGGLFYVGRTGRLTISELAAPVPEPAARALMILGFGAVGGAMRARRRVSVAYA